MKIEIENTTKMIKINGVPARIWEGKTETGIPVRCFVSRIVAESKFDLLQFDRELEQCRTPSPESERYPTKLIL